MDLWVLPPPAKSIWFAKIDWYLNWQMCKGIAYESRRISPELQAVLSENEMRAPTLPLDATAPLLVGCEGRVPATKCVVIGFAKSNEDWLKRAAQICRDLQAHRVKIFLPNGFDRTEAGHLWNGPEIQAEFATDEDTQL